MPRITFVHWPRPAKVAMAIVMAPLIPVWALGHYAVVVWECWVELFQGAMKKRAGRAGEGE